MHVLRYSPGIGTMTSDRFRGLVAGPHAAEELETSDERNDLEIALEGLVELFVVI